MSDVSECYGMSLAIITFCGNFAHRQFMSQVLYFPQTFKGCMLNQYMDSLVC